MTWQLFDESWILLLVLVIGWIRWSMFSGCLKTLLCLCAVPCRVCWWKASFWRCLSLWIVVTWLFVVLCCVVSVCLSSSPIILLLFLFFFLFSCGCTLSKTTMFIVQSSLRSFVRPMYDLSIVCTTTVNKSRDDLQCRNMCGQTDSCLGTDPDPIVRWHGTSFQNTITCVTSCVCVLIPPLCFPLSKIHTHTYTVFLFLFQPMHEWMSWQRRMIWQTVDRWPMTLRWFVPDRGMQYIVKNRYSSVVSCVTDSLCACIVLSLHSLIVVPTNNTLTDSRYLFSFLVPPFLSFSFRVPIFFCHAPIRTHYPSHVQDKTLYTYTGGVATPPLLATLHWGHAAHSPEWKEGNELLRR